MKAKALVDVYVDEHLVAKAGDSYSVDYVDDKTSGGRVFLKGDDVTISISVPVFANFFK